MTREGKCDACRKAKVKCDEVHPTCGPCKRGTRECTYRYGKVKAFVQSLPTRPAFVAGPHNVDKVNGQRIGYASEEPAASARLKLLSTTKASSGGSTFLKFTLDTKRYSVVGERAARGWQRSSQPGAPPHPPLVYRQPLSPAQSILNRWHHFARVIQPDDLCPSLYGWWLEDLPQILDHSPVVESALKCFLDFTVCRVNPTAANGAEALRENIRALRKIKMTLDRGDAEEIQNEVLLSIGLLYFAEYIQRNNMPNTSMIHARGLEGVMQRITDNGQHCNQRCQKIFFGAMLSEEHYGIFEGRDHPFDNGTWINTPVPDMPFELTPDIKATKRYKIDRSIQFSRLVRQVREAREAPLDEVARQKAAVLASELYFPSLDPWLVQLIDLGLISVSRTAESSYEQYTPYSFHFKYGRVFFEVVLYWRLRSAICGTVLALCAIDPPMPCTTSIFDTADVIAEDLQVAENLAACVQYAMASLSLPVPVVAMIFVEHLTMSFGAWHRLEKRAQEGLTTISEAERAHRMKVWICDIADTVCSRCDCPSMSAKFLEAKNEIYMGGPLPSI